VANTVCHLLIQSPLFYQSLLCTSSQAFWSHMWRKFSLRSKPRIATSLPTSSVANLCSRYAYLLSGPNRRWSDGARSRLHDGVGEVQISLPGCFTGSCVLMRTRVIMEQKAPLGQQTSALAAPIDTRCFNAFWPQNTDQGSLFYNGAIRKRCRHLNKIFKQTPH
jgi:hypothetical protein